MKSILITSWNEVYFDNKMKGALDPLKPEDIFSITYSTGVANGPDDRSIAYTCLIILK